MEKERDTFDDMFRSKLQDFEVDTMPGDWEAIADRLPVKAPVPFRRTLRYWAAAAVISLLMITGGVYMFKSEKEVAPIAEKIEKETKKVETELAKEAEALVAPIEPIKEKVTASPVAVVQQPVKVQSTYKAAVKVADTEPAIISSDDDLEEQAEVIIHPDEEPVVVEKEEVAQDHPEVGSATTRSLIADAAPVGKKEKEVSQQYVESLATKTPNVDQLVVNLSGGNQQKVVIAKWLASRPEILILNGPSVGVDVKSKSEIHRILRELAQKGLAVIMISDDVGELLSTTNRILVMNSGRMIFEGETAGLTAGILNEKITQNAGDEESAAAPADRKEVRQL